MRRVALWILGIAGGLVALVLAAVAIAIWAIDVNRFVEPVLARVKASTGRDLVIRGGVRIAPSLTPEVVLSDVSLANAPWGKAPALASARRVEAQIALLPLLSGRIEVIRIGLVEPTIALETDPRGRGNWELTAASPGALAAGPGSSAATPFGVGNLDVQKGVLTYRDGKSGKLTEITIDTLSLRTRDPGAPIQADFRGRVDDVPVAIAGQFGSLETLLVRREPVPIDLAGEVAGQKGKVDAKLRLDPGGVALDDATLAWGAQSLKGRIAINTAGPRPKLVIDATLPALDLTALAPPTRGPPAAAKPSAFVFPDTPVPLGALAAVDADVKLAVAALTIRPGLAVQQAELRFTAQNGRLEAPTVKARLFGGAVDARLTADAARADAPAVTARVEASGIELGPLLAAFGVKREVKDARVNLSADLATRGVSPRAWASAANGNVLVTISRGRLVGTGLDRALPIEVLLDAVNPFRRAGSGTDLLCAVARLPLAGGVARIDRSIAAETAEIDVSASGTLDFRNESLDLSFNPRVRQGIPIDLPQIAQLIRVRGAFAEPRVTVDAVASAATVARIGAAVGTGGLSALGQTLFLKGATGGPGACQVALRGAAAAQEKRAAPAQAQPNPVDQLGKSIQRLFGR